MQSSSKTAIIKSARKNLHLVMTEASITAGLLAMSVFTPFFNSIGLDNRQISETQILYTIVLFLLNVPMGYVADRVSRKWANIIGDFGRAITLLLYSQVCTFGGAVMCECLCGISSALSNGVDSSLIEHFTDKISQQTGESKKALLESKTAKLQIYRQFFNVFLLLLGGPIGAIDLRLAIALSSVNYLAGGIISIFIKDDSEKLHPEHKDPFKDMARVLKTAMKNKSLRTRLFAYAIGRELTHGIIWIVTPLFLKAGVPIGFVSSAWALNAATCILGARFAAFCSKNKKLTDAQIMLLPTVLMSVSMLVIGLNLNIVTVWFYGLMGVVNGWTSSTLIPMVQRHTKRSEQTSIISFAGTLAQMIYIPVVWLVGYVSDIKLEYGPLVMLVIFLPLGLIMTKKLKDI